PDFVQPASRRNEVISFIKQGLKDLSVSRTSFKWGIPLPNDQDHVMYVWMDALSNYMTSLGYGHDNQEKWEKFWPADVHLVGKDILRFHAIFWPAFLMSAGVELPKTVFAHGWWTVEGEKMSKSKGNFVDPFAFVDTYGADPFRYFLLKEFTFGQDGNFSKEQFVQRLNTELANELGNLVSRSISMVEKYCAGKIPDFDADQTDAFLQPLHAHFKQYQEKIEHLKFDQAFSHIWDAIKVANQYIEQQQPWTLAKNQDTARLGTTLYNILETIRMVSIAIAPVMPTMSDSIRQKLGLKDIEAEVGKNLFSDVYQKAVLLPGQTICKGEALFQRIEA
ncbi:MAG: methionine--tRNA ligase, partial [Deltaproteobacteria bacterium]|nr:methionine--tRNA ligase [Deltaproteobacteria bacterium]